jgi:predicted glycosyltransferase involved in capsule biosynthesis
MAPDTERVRFFMSNDPLRVLSKIEAVPEACLLTVIVPLRVRDGHEDAIKRLDFALMDSERPREVGFLVVDDGSAADLAERVRERCRQLGFGYVRLETADREFSVGRCRNIGAMVAKSPFIFMQDLDLMPWDGFYRELLLEMEIQGLRRDARAFLMVPYVYLTSGGTESFLECPPQEMRQRFQHAALAGDARVVEKMSTGTSANVYNRFWYLSRGGNCSDFEGWGYEDQEFNARLLQHWGLFPEPAEWSREKYNFNSVVKYRTWKASYRLLGDLLFQKGIALFHAWHPVAENSNYRQRADANRAVFLSRLEEFEKKGTEPDPLPDLNRGCSLLMRKNAFTCARDIQPLWGRILHPDEDLLEGRTSLKDWVLRNKIDRLVFHNPYASEAMLRLYREARTEGIPYFVAERGALPGSCFFDPEGFLVDGGSYAAERWDRPLDTTERTHILADLEEMRGNAAALEDQAPRVGASALRKELGLEAWEKVLFLCLQRPGDSVTRNFCGPIGSYGAYIKLMEEVAGKMPEGWRLVVKKHPLEDAAFDFPGALYANGAHVHDLLELCDSVATFNSGVGVLALLWEKPVILSGLAYYAHSSLNRMAITPAELMSCLETTAEPDPEKVLRFLHYLIHEYYCFGEFATKPVRMPDGSRMTATTDIRFSQIRLSGTQMLTGRAVRGKSIGWESPLFDRYRSWEDTRQKLKQLFDLKSAKKNRFPTLALLKILDDPEVAPPPIQSKREHGKSKALWWRKIGLPLRQWALELKLRHKWKSRKWPNQ